MRILFVCKTLPHTYKGGIQTHVWKLSLSLIERGHHVSILTAGSFKHSKKVHMMDGIELIEIPYLPLRRLGILSTLLDELAFNIAAKKWLKANQANYDIIHLQGRSGAMFLHEKTDSTEKPVVATIHGFIEQEYHFEKFKSLNFIDKKLHQYFATKLENCTLRYADALIPVSHFMAFLMNERNTKRHNITKVIPNGIDIKPAPDEYNFKNNKLVFVGRLVKLKGIYELVDAMEHTHTDIELTIIGDGPERERLVQYIDSKDLTHRVTLTGALGEADVIKHIDESRALILPSFHESQGIVLMEANVRCKPVIASNIPGINEVVTDGINGLLFPVGEAKEMAIAIDKVFSSLSEAVRMGITGRQRMEHDFSWQCVAARTEALYQSLIGESKVSI